MPTDYECAMAAARVALSEAGWEAVWVEGMAMTLEQTITETLVKPTLCNAHHR